MSTESRATFDFSGEGSKASATGSKCFRQSGYLILQDISSSSENMDFYTILSAFALLFSFGHCDDVQYQVSIKTGDRNYAGTDANVFLTIFGDLGTTMRHDLDTPRDDFEVSNTDVFVFTDVYVGPISKIYLEQDNSGRSSGWFVEWVKIASNDSSAVFLLNRWFSTSDEWGLDGYFYPD